jgi:L-aspartate oxidase
VADDFRALPLMNPRCERPVQVLDLDDIRNSLKSLMWRSAGVQRERERLDEAAKMIANWQRYVLAGQFEELRGWELQNMLTVASVIVAAARQRTESRGVHLRTDFPRLNDAEWKRHLVFRRGPDGLINISDQPVSAPVLS